MAEPNRPPPHGSAPAASLAFLQGGGEMGELIRGHDWAATPIGPPETWPQSLRTTVRLMLTTNHPVYIFWGARHTCLYNDAYRHTLDAARHPASLGEPAREVWAEIWPIIGPQIDDVLAGRGATWHVEQLVPITRNGVRQDVYWTYGYSPIDVDDGIGGVLVICNDVTEEHRRTVALRDGEARWRNLFREMRDGFFIGEAMRDAAGRMTDFRFLEINPAFQALTGLSAQAAVGRGVREAIPGIQQELIDACAGVVDSGEAAHVEIYLPALGGRWFEVRATRSTAERFAVIFFDISSRKASEAMLSDSEAQFRTIAQSMPNQVWAASADGRLDWFSQNAYDYIGLGFDQLSGFGWTQAVHLDDLPLATACWARAIGSGEPYQTEARIRRHDGAFRWHLIRAVALRDARQRVVRWIGTNTDIEEQRQSFDELSRLNARLANTLQAQLLERDMIWRTSKDLFVTCGIDGLYRSVNAAWSESLGWEAEALVGQRFDAFVHPEDLARVGAQFNRLASGHSVNDFDSRLRDARGQYRWYSWTAVTEGDVFYATGRDITARRELEQQLRQSQKMEAVGQLTGGIAHDFNNLLQAITGSLEVMRKRIEQGRLGELERFTTGALSAAARAAALTHRLLAFSRRQPLDPKPVKANPLLSSMEDLLRRTLREHISLEMVLAGGLWPTLCDPNQLESSILNLAINARDAMPDGGRLTIETCNAQLDSFPDPDSGVTPGQYVCIAVSDSGTGMTPDVVERAFDPFFTTKPLGQGTGLGLSMIYGFARQSQGHCKIYSEVGRGSTVKLYLPRFDGLDVADAPPAGAPAAHDAEHGEVVLVIEDEAVVRGLIVEALAELGYQALQAADGPSGLEILQSTRRIDLLVTDIGLPGLNGRQVADAARVRRPEMKVLFMTGYAENAAFAQGFLEPGMAMITKPFAMEALALRLRDMLGPSPQRHRNGTVVLKPRSAPGD